MLRVAGASQLGTYSSCPPRSYAGEAEASRAWLWALPDRNIPQVGFRQPKEVNQKTRRRGWSGGWRVLLCVYHEGVVGLGLWISFLRAVRRTSLRESYRTSCPVVVQGISATALYLPIGGFSRFLFSKLFLGRMVLASLCTLGIQFVIQVCSAAGIAPRMFANNGCGFVMHCVNCRGCWHLVNTHWKCCSSRCCA